MRAMKLGIISLAVVFACAPVCSAERRTSVAISLGAFMPRSSSVKDEFGSSWTRVSFKTFEPSKPTHWRFTGEVGHYALDGTRDVRLLPLTFGVERGLRESRSIQPYLTLRAGPYFGRIQEDAIGLDENHVGLNTNAAYGVVLKRRYYAEVRYDYFTRMAGANFDGLSLSVGMRLFDIRY